MAQLDRINEAAVPQSKIENYLLNPEHPIGAGKAKFFVHFGFCRENRGVLADALRRHLQENAVASSLSDTDGM